MILSTDTLEELIFSAYQHLYDFVYLRTHPLAKAITSEAMVNAKERGWQLHKLLLETINELDPGPNAPLYSKEWRRYRLMVLRYVDGAEPRQVADHLAISRRQFYREHAAAIEAVASVLSTRYQVDRISSHGPESLLHQEVARIVQHEQGASLDHVVNGVLSLLGQALDVRQINVIKDMVFEHLPPVMVSHNVLRQALLGVLGYLIENLQHAEITFSTQITSDGIHLQIETNTLLDEMTSEIRITPYREMLSLEEADLKLMIHEGQPVSFMMTLPTHRRSTVLVVDDNEDMLILYERYLTANHYQVICADTAASAIDIAVRFQPTYIILDLMMPDQDGWELLKKLGSNSSTAQIPLLVCSVLKQRDLALTLGASQFLEKPTTESDLLEALSAMEIENDTR